MLDAALFKVVSYSVSTSNHNRITNFIIFVKVVSYSVSTSNHNQRGIILCPPLVVSYSVSTSNHNVRLLWKHAPAGCILFCFYIKSQQRHYLFLKLMSCILFCFYIKSQLIFVNLSASFALYLILFLHQITT